MTLNYAVLCIVVRSNPVICFVRLQDTVVTHLTANTLDHAINPNCYRHLPRYMTHTRTRCVDLGLLME